MAGTEAESSVCFFCLPCFVTFFFNLMGYYPIYSGTLVSSLFFGLQLKWVISIVGLRHFITVLDLFCGTFKYLLRLSYHFSPRDLSDLMQSKWLFWIHKRQTHELMVQRGVTVVRTTFCLSPCAWIAKETFHEAWGAKQSLSIYK